MGTELPLLSMRFNWHTTCCFEKIIWRMRCTIPCDLLCLLWSCKRISIKLQLTGTSRLILPLDETHKHWMANYQVLTQEERPITKEWWNGKKYYYYTITRVQRLRTKVGESPSFSTPGVDEQLAPGYHPTTPQAAPFSNGDIKTDSGKTHASDLSLFMAMLTPSHLSNTNQVHTV